MKILITGANGYVGARLYKDLQDREFSVQGTYNKHRLFPELIQVDLTKEESVEALFQQTKPDILIHAAALPNTSSCLKDPEYAHKLNVEATQYLVNEAKLTHAKVIYISTFACYNKDGDSVYFKTKSEAERIVRILPNSIILRLSLVVGLSPNTTSKNFFNELLAAYKARSAFEADSSFEFEMTYLGTLIDMVAMLLKTPDIEGVTVPCFDKGVTSKYKIAKALLGTEGKLSEQVSGRLVPLPEIDLAELKNFNLPIGEYNASIEMVKAELNSL